MSDLVLCASASRRDLNTLLSATREHADELRAWARSVDLPGGARRPGLIGVDRAATIRVELARAMIRGTDAMAVLGLVAKLCAAYPLRASENSADMEAYMALLVEELAVFPEWALSEALAKVPRRRKFRPTLKEVLDAVEEELQPVRDLQAGLATMERARQAAEVSREAEATERVKRAQIEADRLEFAEWSAAQCAAGLMGGYRDFMRHRGIPV